MKKTNDDDDEGLARGPGRGDSGGFGTAGTRGVKPTNTVRGKAAHYEPGASKSLGYGDIEVGMCLFAPKGHQKPCRDLRRIVVAGVVCPYCRGPVSRLDPREGRVDGRVVALTKPDAHRDRVDVVVDPIPASYWTVRCNPCRAQFVLPKRVPAWVRASVTMPTLR